MQVSKWGNSLAVRLPAKLVEELGLKEGDEIEMRRATDGAVEIEKRQALADWFARLAAIEPKLPADYTFQRRDAYPANRGGRDDDGQS